MLHNHTVDYGKLKPSVEVATKVATLARSFPLEKGEYITVNEEEITNWLGKKTGKMGVRLIKVGMHTPARLEKVVKALK